MGKRIVRISSHSKHIWDFLPLSRTADSFRFFIINMSSGFGYIYHGISPHKNEKYLDIEHKNDFVHEVSSGRGCFDPGNFRYNRGLHTISIPGPLFVLRGSFATLPAHRSAGLDLTHTDRFQDEAHESSGLRGFWKEISGIRGSIRRLILGRSL